MIVLCENNMDCFWILSFCSLLYFVHASHKCTQVNRLEKLECTVNLLNDQLTIVSNEQNKKIEDLQKQLYYMEQLLTEKCNQPVQMDTESGATNAENDKMKDASNASMVSKAVQKSDTKMRNNKTDTKRRNISYSKAVFLNILNSDIGKKSRIWKRDAGRNTSDIAAFYARMMHHTTPGRGQVLVFEDVITDNTNNYNKFTGIFTASESGIYVFCWTIVTSSELFTQLVLNTDEKGSMYSDTDTYYETVTGQVVVQINVGDVVYVRANPDHPIKGTVISYPDQHSSFMGWKIF